MAYLKERMKCNLRNIGKHERFKKIICPKCGKEQPLAIDWDYQKCDRCAEYMYDDRGLN